MTLTCFVLILASKHTS